MSDPSVEEVRVAMALNGGVSLAIWMGGCAVEIDCARRAYKTGPEEILNVGPEEIEKTPPPDLKTYPTRTIYAAICRSLSRCLVVDVMSGSSAGGINGALLAAATVGQRRLHPEYVRKRWLDLGDLSRLLHPLTVPDPYSLMSGDYFHTELLNTFKAIRWEEPRGADDPEPLNAPPVVPDLLEPPPFLDVTTTDVVGAGRRFADVWGGELTALEYRARFRFRKNDQYTAATLAAAARSSASFPLAFEPFKVKEPGAKALARFAEDRLVIDGGLLDNAPIAAAIDLVKARPAQGSVKRYLCYVNGEPKDVTLPPPDDPEDPEAKFKPRLPRVLANVLGLPRKAPFADQLSALEDASWRGDPTSSAELALLGLEAATLQEAARALLEIYRKRRRMVSLRELVDAPALSASDKLGTEHELPWIPRTMDPPGPGQWGWGVQAARRVHHLMIDLIREALRSGRPEFHDDLLRARNEINTRVVESEARRAEAADDDEMKGRLSAVATASDPAAALRDLSEALPWDEGELRDEVLATAETVFRVRHQLDTQERVVIGAALFGSGWDGDALTDEMKEHFLRRVLAVEVVKRAFGMDRDIDDGQQLNFAQLTPFAPCPLLDQKPMSGAREWTPEDKLTGIRLAHFAAFHRRSWRANDYLWGRMDGAARVVAMLVDAGRVVDVEGEKPWLKLAEALVPDVPAPDAPNGRPQFVAELHRLAEEALKDFEVPRPGSGDLRSRVAAALKHDLVRRLELAQRGEFTRVMCIRAAQLEVLAHELPSLIDEAEGDVGLGASSGPLELPREAERLGEAVELLRRPEPSLPVQLARDAPEEVVSNLALRTVSHSGLVSLAVLRGSTVPMIGPLQILRALFLSVAGMVTSDLPQRIAVLLAFTASVLYLTARAVAVTTVSSDVEDLSKDGLVLALICLFVIAGVAVVPALRAWGRRSLDRWLHGLIALVLLVGVAVCAVVAAVRGAPTWADAVVAGGFDPPGWLFWAPFALILGTLPRFMPAALARVKFLRAPWYPLVGLALALASSAIVGVWSLLELLDAHPAWWVWIGGIAAVAVTIAYVLFLGPVVKAVRQLKS